MRRFVRKIGNGYHAAFDWAGVSYSHSLRTQDETEAEVRIGPIRGQDLARGWHAAKLVLTAL
jgi:hypothetical protein